MPATRILKVLLVLPLLAFLTGAAGSPAGGGKATPPADGRLAADQISASVRASMDLEADPCQDFYRYACGGWLDAVELPGDQSRWGRGFSEIQERNRGVLKELLEQAVRMAGDVEEFALIGNYYGACMNEAEIEKAGPAPLRPMLRQINEIGDAGALLRVIGQLHRVSVPVLWNGAVFPDFKNPGINIAHFFQGGLGLPDRDYYLSEEKKDVLVEYQAHVARMLQLVFVPENQAKKLAEGVVALEKRLAEASLPRAETRDPEKIYNKIDMVGLRKLTPEIPWDSYLKSVGAPDLDGLNVAVPAFMERVQDVILTTDPDTMKAYLRWNLLSSTAGYLSSEFVDEDFAFFGKELSGQQELEDRWKRCVSATDGAVGEALAQAYIDRQFAGDSKDKAVAMIVRIEEAFADNLKNLSWMDDETRKRAFEKMKAITNKIAYPDEWRDYSGLQFKPNRHLVNAMLALEFEFQRNLDKLGKPVDRNEWFMTPPTVNAYYNPLNNEMVFPAGIMQAPFFHRDFPAAMNFGGIGMVMGHELTHGFDDSGRKFDRTGQMQEWWDPSVVEKFEVRAECVADLYESFEVQPDLHLNGQLTLGENIADFGGIKEAHGAYRAWAEENGEPASPVDGLSSDQLFFVGFAQTWCSVSAPEFERMLVTVDPHSPPRFRVNGPLANFPTFGETFECEAGSPMRPAEICEVW